MLHSEPGQHQYHGISLERFHHQPAILTRHVVPSTQSFNPTCRRVVCVTSPITVVRCSSSHTINRAAVLTSRFSNKVRTLTAWSWLLCLQISFKILFCLPSLMASVSCFRSQLCLVVRSRFQQLDNCVKASTQGSFQEFGFSDPKQVCSSSCPNSCDFRADLNFLGEVWRRSQNSAP